MKALTLWQPWAHLVACGIKPVENRPWAPPSWLRGRRFAIHAGKRWDQASADRIEEILGVRLEREDCTFGAVIATAVLARWTEDPLTIRPAHRRWFFGPWGWLLIRIEAIEPIPCRGYQKLWNLPREVGEQLILRDRIALELPRRAS